MKVSKIIKLLQMYCKLNGKKFQISSYCITVLSMRKGVMHSISLLVILYCVLIYRGLSGDFP